MRSLCDPGITGPAHTESSHQPGAGQSLPVNIGQVASVCSMFHQYESLNTGPLTQTQIYLLVRIVSQTIVMAVTGPVEQSLERCLQLSLECSRPYPVPAYLPYHLLQIVCIMRIVGIGCSLWPLLITINLTKPSLLWHCN